MTPRMQEIDKILADYEIPSPSELGKAGSYIQNTPRAVYVEKRRKNDILFVPIGCTENHGMHANSGLDTFMVTQILEGVRRYTAKQGREVNLAFTPLNYGGHPYHHMGMPGTVIIPQEVVAEMLIYTMLGLWNDGYRKIILLNNHGQLWMLEDAIQEFMKRFSAAGDLPGAGLAPSGAGVLHAHRARRTALRPISSMPMRAKPPWHCSMFNEMIDMQYVQDAEGQTFLPDGHFDTVGGSLPPTPSLVRR